MDISGQVRGVLRQFAPAVPAQSLPHVDPVGLLVLAIAHPEMEITMGSTAGTPGFLGEHAPLLIEARHSRPVYAGFNLACAMRVLPRITRQERVAWRKGLQRQVAGLVGAGEHMLLARDTKPVAFLWQHWLLMLAQEHAGLAVPETLMKGLVRRGMAAVSRGAVAPLHAPAASSALEGFVYDDLCALHAAFNAAVMAGDRGEQLMAAAEKVVKWHVENTQPDNTTQEPWAVAAFAALDDTATFASQQVHDAIQRLTTSPAPRTDGGILAGLLADAIVTQGG